MDNQTQGQDPQEDKLISISEVARMLNVSTQSVRLWAKKGILPSVRLVERGRRHFKESDVKRLMNQRGMPA